MLTLSFSLPGFLFFEGDSVPTLGDSDGTAEDVICKLVLWSSLMKWLMIKSKHKEQQQKYI